MQLIRGDYLPPELKRQVLAAFVHRWTHENAQQTYGGRCPACVQQQQCVGRQKVQGKEWREADWHAYHKPLVSDAEWLRSHVFHVTNRGTLSARHKWAEPYYAREEVNHELA